MTMGQTQSAQYAPSGQQLCNGAVQQVKEVTRQSTRLVSVDVEVLCVRLQACQQPAVQRPRLNPALPRCLSSAHVLFGRRNGC